MLFTRPPRSIFDPPTTLECLLTSPVTTLLRTLYRLLSSLRNSPAPSDPPIRIVCISDTHTQTYPIPLGDLLIHAGDLTNAGTLRELQAQIDWLASLPHPHKVAIAGNHDTYLDPRSRATLPPEDREGELDWKDVHYLQYSSITLTFPPSSSATSSFSSSKTAPSSPAIPPKRTLRIHGAPQIPACGGADFAFQHPRGEDAWSDTVSRDTDVLVTHAPPAWHGDLPAGLGCPFLLRETWRVRPRLHVCGHVHAGAGKEAVWWDGAQAAYERGCERGKRARKGARRGRWPVARGFVGELVDLRLWAEVGRVVVYGLAGVVWDRVWGGEQSGGVVVNAALMVNNTGRLGNRVQVVEI